MGWIGNLINKLAKRSNSQREAEIVEAIDLPHFPNAIGKSDTLEEGRRALEVIRRDHPVVMILGRAGTGKTTLIRQIVDQGGDNQVVLAFTGVAAVNAGGQTLHSFFGIPPRMHNLSDIQPRQREQPMFRNLRRVIIDEISMVRADLLDSIDHALKINRGSSAPFGGVQMVFVGDFLQLPPVTPSAEIAILEHRGYRGHFAFDSACYDEDSVMHVELSRIYRQDDPVFIRMLGDLREGNNLAETIQFFNGNCLGDHRSQNVPVVLAATNDMVGFYNQRGLASLPGQPRVYVGQITGNFLLKGDKLPVPDRLSLKAGARIMMVRNDPNKNWVNGTLGTLQRIGETSVWVKFDRGPGDYEVTMARWESVRYTWDRESNRVVSEVVGTYSQLPLIPAWGLTIHKAQGLTLEDVRVDMQTGTFASGQAYVALSRARSLSGLSLASPLSPADVKIDARLLAFIRNRRNLVSL